MPPISPFAGQPVPRSLLVDIPRLVTAYFALRPDPAILAQRVSFGTSGHRGCAFATSFNEAHILAISQAVCQHRAQAGIDGPLFIGIDTHALSRPALASALEVFAANEVDVFIDAQDGYTPYTGDLARHPRAIIAAATSDLADGVVITPSHNPPEDGGYKYNPPHGGPADADVTKVIERTANDLLAASLSQACAGCPARARLNHRTCIATTTSAPYVADLGAVVDMEAIRASGVKIGIDPLGGAAVAYWGPNHRTLRYRGHLSSATWSTRRFRFMTADWDGQIRMDCSSPYAMARLIGMHGSLRCRLRQRHRCRPPRHRRRRRMG